MRHESDMEPVRGSQGSLRDRGGREMRWGHYALAVGSAGAAVGLRLLAADVLTAPYLLPMAAVMLSATVGGLGPGITATAASAAGMYATLFNPAAATQDLVGLAVFAAVGLVISVIAAQRRTAMLLASGQAEELQLALQAKAASEERLALAIRATGAGVWDWDVRHDRMNWDDRMLELYGVDRGKAPATVAAWEDTLHPEDRVRAISENADALAGRRPFDTEFRVKRPDGSVVFIKADGLVLRDPDGTPRRMIGLNRDVTAQKAAERALREGNEVLVRFVKDSPVYAFVKEVRPGRSVVVAASENYQEMVGIPGSRMVGKAMEELFPPEFAEKITADDWSVVSGGKILTLDEELNGRAYTTIKFPIFLESRTLLAGYTIDVTDRTRVEEALRESQRVLLLSQAIAHIGSYVLDVQRDHWSSSAELDAIFGIDEDYPRKGSDWVRLVHPEDREVAALHLADVLGRGSRFDLQYRVVNPRSGETRWVHGLGEVERGPGGEAVKLVGTIQDITARKLAALEREALQGKLALASRLAAMGTLVAGVAHEINNPLAADMAGAGLALEEARDLQRSLRGGARVDGAALLRRLEAIVEALEEATSGSAAVARIVKDLATFANPDPRRTRVLLADVAGNAIRWMPVALGRNVDIRVEDQGAPPVMASAGQIEQVVVNLLTNAAKATPPGERGDIVVQIGPGGGGTARLDVIDKGVGIDPRIRERIFEPFFTTRRVGIGRGAGLWLAICHAIVTDHGGSLSVESEVGKGSTFRVELPAASAGT